MARVLYTAEATVTGARASGHGRTNDGALDVRLGLPKLPAELDYRLAGHDLVLWDIYAGIVVDFVPDIVTSPVATN